MRLTEKALTTTLVSLDATGVSTGFIGTDLSRASSRSQNALKSSGAGFAGMRSASAAALESKTPEPGTCRPSSSTARTTRWTKPGASSFALTTSGESEDASPARRLPSSPSSVQATRRPGTGAFLALRSTSVTVKTISSPQA